MQLAWKNQGCGGGIWQQGPHSNVDEGVQASKSKMLNAPPLKPDFPHDLLFDGFRVQGLGKAWIWGSKIRTNCRTINVGMGEE